MYVFKVHVHVLLYMYYTVYVYVYMYIHTCSYDIIRKQTSMLLFSKDIACLSHCKTTVYVHVHVCPCTSRIQTPLELKISIYQKPHIIIIDWMMVIVILSIIFIVHT